MGFLEKLISDLKQDEGFNSSAYLDVFGYWTIGYGRLIDARKGGGIDEIEAEYLLRNDVIDVLKQLSALDFWDSLDETRQLVLANMAFNLGIGGLMKFRKTLDLVASHRYEEAAIEMLKSTWAEQVPSRALRLSELMRDGPSSS